MAAVKFKSYFTLELGDINGDVAIMRIPSVISDDTASIANQVTIIDALVTALGAPGTITNGKVIRSSFSFVRNEAQLAGGTPALDAEFPSVADKARLQFTNAQGSRLVVAVPAPIEAIFHAPPADDTVDPASAVSALIAVVEANAHDIGSNVLNLYQGGVRQKSRARRRKQHRL
jgi:hypothetical protein